MTVEAVEPTAGFPIYGQPIRGRACAACKACCTVVPVASDGLDKPAGVRCRYLVSRGCSVYARRPEPCRAWSCRWLFDDMAAGLRRPDLSGYIVDPMLDTALGNGQPFEMLQVWIDPARRDAHQAPELRAYLAAIAQRYRLPAFVRWNSQDGMLLVAPCLSSTGEWLEMRGEMNTQAELNAKLAEAGYGNPLQYRASFVQGGIG